MRFIESGDLNKKVGYKIAFVENPQIVDEVVKLQQLVKDDLNNPETYVMDSKEFLLNEILPQGKGFMIGVFSEGSLIALRTISFPAPDSEYNLAAELDIPKNELNKVAVLEATIVHPDYRGNRLQRKMLGYTLPRLEEKGYIHVCSTISPYNYPSLSSVMSFGLTIRDLKIRGGVYGGKLRFLLARNLENDIEKYTDNVTVGNGNIQIQQQLLEEGYIGHTLVKKDNNFNIIYGKPFNSEK